MAVGMFGGGPKRGGKGYDQPADYVFGMGKRIKTKSSTGGARGGKGDDGPQYRYEAEINPNYRENPGGGKTGAGKYQRVDLPEGGNILEMQKILSFKESLKQGTRADDPRNWEFYFKEPGSPGGKIGSAGWSDTKGMSGAERRQGAYARAKNKAMREAKYAGQDVYATLEAEYETARIQDEMRRDRLMSRMKQGPEGFGSTRVARSVAAQKALAGRTAVTGQAGRATGATAGPFQGPSRREAARGGQTVARVARQGRRASTT